MDYTIRKHVIYPLQKGGSVVETLEGKLAGLDDEGANVVLTFDSGDRLFLKKSYISYVFQIIYPIGFMSSMDNRIRISISSNESQKTALDARIYEIAEDTVICKLHEHRIDFYKNIKTLSRDEKDEVLDDAAKKSTALIQNLLERERKQSQTKVMGNVLEKLRQPVGDRTSEEELFNEEELRHTRTLDEVYDEVHSLRMFLMEAFSKGFVLKMND